VVKAVGRGLVVMSQIALTIATACRPYRAFIEFYQHGHCTQRNVTNAAWALFDDALAEEEGMWHGHD